MEYYKLENGIPVLDTDELYLHKEFQPVLKNTYNKGCDGDSTGNSRNLSKKLFKFFYFYCNWKSPYIGEDDDTRRDKSLVSSGLGLGYKLQQDEKNALDYYKSLLTTCYPQINILRTLKENLRLIDKSSALISRQLNDLYNRLEKTDSIEDNMESIENYQALIKLYNQTLDSQLTIGDKVDKLTSDITKMEAQLKEKEMTTKYLKGGQVKTGRKDPK